MLRLRAAVINIPTSAGRRAWRRCWGLTQRRADVFGVNEAFHPDARALYRRLARLKGYGHFGLSNPVFWDEGKFRFVSGRVVVMHDRATDARARRWPGFNASRSCTEVVLSPIGGGPEVAVLCTHWVPRGPKVSAAWRKDARRRSKAHVQPLAHEHLAERRVAVLLGDLNIGRPFSLPPFAWLRGRGVDKVGIALPAGLVRTATRTRTFKAPTDHRHGVVAVVRLATRSTR